MKRKIEDNPWVDTIEFIHQNRGLVVKRCDISDLPNPLPLEYRLAVPEEISLRMVNQAAADKAPATRCAVFRLSTNGQGRPAYFFDRVEAPPRQGDE